MHVVRDSPSTQSRLKSVVCSTDVARESEAAPALRATAILPLHTIAGAVVFTPTAKSTNLHRH